MEINREVGLGQGSRSRWLLIEQLLTRSMVKSKGKTTNPKKLAHSHCFKDSNWAQVIEQVKPEAFLPIDWLSCGTHVWAHAQQCSASPAKTSTVRLVFCPVLASTLQTPRDTRLEADRGNVSVGKVGCHQLTSVRFFFLSDFYLRRSYKKIDFRRLGKINTARHFV